MTRQWMQDSHLRGLWQQLALVDDDNPCCCSAVSCSALLPLDCAGHDPFSGRIR